eukprot:4577023-Pyramimonas_sp.AAC.1
MLAPCQTIGLGIPPGFRPSGYPYWMVTHGDKLPLPQESEQLLGGWHKSPGQNPFKICPRPPPRMHPGQMFELCPDVATRTLRKAHTPSNVLRLLSTPSLTALS